MTPKEFKQWIKIHKEWEDLVGPKKKEEDPKKKEPPVRKFHPIEVFLILMGTSPFVFLAYKLWLIPIIVK